LKKNESPKVQQEALSRLLVEKGMFTKEEFLEMVKVVDSERMRREANPINLGWPLAEKGC